MVKLITIASLFIGTLILGFVPKALAISQTPIKPQNATPLRQLADLNKDNFINDKDLRLFVQNFTTQKSLTNDLNQDGKIDIFDYNLFVKAYLEG